MSRIPVSMVLENATLIMQDNCLHNTYNAVTRKRSRLGRPAMARMLARCVRPVNDDNNDDEAIG